MSDITVTVVGRTPNKITISNNNRELLITQTGNAVGRLTIIIIIPVNIQLPYYVEVTSGSLYIINNIAFTSATIINHKGSAEITMMNIQDTLNITTDSGSVKILDIHGGNHIVAAKDGSIVMNSCSGGILDIKVTAGTVKERNLSYVHINKSADSGTIDIR